MTLDPLTFIKRFLLHILPTGFVRIRAYGILANPCKKDILPLCLSLLGVQPEQQTSEQQESPRSWQELLLSLTGADPSLCPHCKKGHLQLIQEIPRLKAG